MGLAKSRDWTQADVQAAIDVIKAVPGLWEELEKIEQATKIDARKVIETGRREYDVLVRLHPDADLNELTDLYIPIQKLLREGLQSK
jgi:hypothetical protein